MKIVLGVPPGGGLDVLVRGIAAELSTKWGQSVVVDNKPGASGMIAAEGIANAAPDGYSLLATTDQIYMGNRYLFKKLPYDPDKSFANITIMARAEQFLLANPAVPATTLPELIAADKRKPGSLAYGSWGDGSPPQFVYEMLNKSAGTKFLHVPYKGVAPVLAALTGNEIQLSVGSSGVAGGLLQGRQGQGAGARRQGALAALPRRADHDRDGPSRDPGLHLVRPRRPRRHASADRRQDQRRRSRDREAARLHRALRHHARLDAHRSTPAETDEIIKSELPIIRDMSAAAGVKPQ